jgi:hypothetical protein
VKDFVLSLETELLIESNVCCLCGLMANSAILHLSRFATYRSTPLPFDRYPETPTWRCRVGFCLRYVYGFSPGFCHFPLLLAQLIHRRHMNLFRNYRLLQG